MGCPCWHFGFLSLRVLLLPLYAQVWFFGFMFMYVIACGSPLHCDVVSHLFQLFSSESMKNFFRFSFVTRAYCTCRLYSSPSHSYNPPVNSKFSVFRTRNSCGFYDPLGVSFCHVSLSTFLPFNDFMHPHNRFSASIPYSTA